MNLRRHQPVPISLLVAALLVCSCGPSGGKAAQTVVATAMPTPAPSAITAAGTSAPSTVGQQAQLPSTLPVDTAQPPTSATRAPIVTSRPSPSPTSTHAPTPSVLPVQPITPANADQVVLLERLGQGALQDMAWLQDGRTVVAAYRSGLSLCDADTLEECRFVPLYGWKASLAASPDGHYLAMIAEQGLQLWDLTLGRLVHTLAEPSGGTKLVAFGANGKTLAILGSEVAEGASHDTVAVWDLSALLGGSADMGHLLYRLDGFSRAVTSLAFSPDGRILVTSRQQDFSVPNDVPLGLWDGGTGEALSVEGDLSVAPGGLDHLVFSPDGRLLAGTDISTIHVWDATSGKLLHSLENESSPDTLAFSADAQLLAAGSRDEVVRVWDVMSGQLKRTISGCTADLIRVAFDPAPSTGTGEALLATATARDGVQLWDVESGRQVAARPPVGHTDSVEAIAYSPDGALLATASTDQTVWLWDADSGRALRMLDAYGMNSEEWCACIWSLAFSPDGKALATGSTDARVRLWDVQSGELLETSQALGDLVYGLGFSPDGRRLAAGDADGNLWVWDLAAPLSSAPLLTLDNGGVIVSLSFNPAPSSPGGHVLATGSGFGAIRVWDIDTGALEQEMAGSHNSVRAVYSPDGSLLAAGDSGWAEEFPVRLWDPASGELRRTLPGHTKDIGGLAFTLDGRVLASGDWDGLTKLWDVGSGEQLQVLQQAGSVKSAAFRPDGGRLATAGFDGLVSIWGVP
jgi:WD40 repeat protein